MQSVTNLYVVFYDSRFTAGADKWEGTLVFLGRAPNSRVTQEFRESQTEYPSRCIQASHCEEVTAALLPLHQALEAVKAELSESSWGAVYGSDYKFVIDKDKVHVLVQAPHEEAVIFVSLQFGLPLEKVEIVLTLPSEINPVVAFGEDACNNR
jgi:hypothetical protein